MLKQLVSSENTERMEGLSVSLLTSIGREVKMALANSGRKFSPEEVVELREQFNSVSEFPQFFVCSNRVSSRVEWGMGPPPG